MDLMDKGPAAPEGATTLDRRDEIIRQMYLDNERHYSVEEIGLKVGLCAQSVRNRAHQLGLRRPKRYKAPGTKVLSTMHQTIGQKLSHFRMFTSATDGQLSTVADKLNISVKRLVQIERGTVELSLSEVSKIATLLGLSIDKLLTPGVFAQ